MYKWALLVFLALSSVCALAVPAAKTVTLTDYLGAGWQDELVHYPLDFPPGAFTGKAFVRVEIKGKQAIPSQVTDVVRNDDGSVRSCNVWFFATIPPNGAVTYLITPGKSGPVDAGVTVTSTPETLELTTTIPEKIGVRLLNGTKEYAWPVAAADVPGPLQALLLPSGRTTGKGCFAAPFNVRSYATEITARGPLFAEARVRYQFDKGYWTFTARVQRGCPMVIINEEFDTGYSGQAWDAADRFYTFTLNGGGFAPTQAYYTGRTDAESFHNLVNQYIQPVLQDAGLDRGGPGSTVNGYTLTYKEDRTDYFLTAWPTWSARAGVAIRFVEPGKDAVGFASIDTNAWRNPLALRFRTAANGELSVGLPIQVYQQDWPSEGFGRTSPNYTGKTLGVPEGTARRQYGIMLTPAEDEQQTKLVTLLRQTVKLGAQPFDEVKDWVLEWPDPLTNAQWAPESTPAGKKALTFMRNYLAAKRAVGNYGSYSMWTYRTLTHERYDIIAPVLNDPAALSAADHRELRRLCAFQAYVLNSLDELPWGAGPHLGNPNMSIMAMNARAKSALLVKDHPQFRTWGDWTLAFTKNYIERYTRDTGAPYEDPQYTLGVTLLEIAQVNQILMDAGIGDALDTPRYKACMRFILDWSLPADPRFQGHRQMLPFGNGSSYNSIYPDFTELMVRYYQQRDPQLAAQFQWVANQSLPEEKQVHIVKDEVPELGSVHHTDYGVTFRHGYGTPYETFFFLMAGNCDGHYEWESDQMAYTLYAKGQPINLHFGNGYMPMFNRPWLRNRVSIDHMYEQTERNLTRVMAAGFTPEAEYVRAVRDIDSIRPLKTEYPLTTPNGTALAPEENANWSGLPEWQRIPLTAWYRQVLFLKDTDPKGPNYFVLRDTFGGAPTRPTDMSLWFLANNMTRKGDLYHFDGQCNVDMDVFVATPAGVEPETGKYGHPQWPYGRLVGFDPKFFPDGKLQETQLFLRLKQPAGKGYLVVLYPRLKQDDPEALYSALADGVVRVQTPLSTDYAFLQPGAFTFQDERVVFRGIAGAVRFYKSGKIAVMNSEGKAEITVAGKTISRTGTFNVILDHGAVTTSPQGAPVVVREEG